MTIRCLAEKFCKIGIAKAMRENIDAGTKGCGSSFFDLHPISGPHRGSTPFPGGMATSWDAGYGAAALSMRFLIFKIVARLHPVNDWIVFHDCLASSMAAILALRSVSSGRPL